MELDKKYDGTGNLMDMYDALSNGQFFDRMCDGVPFTGHGSKYYSGSQSNRNTEKLIIIIIYFCNAIEPWIVFHGQFGCGPVRLKISTTALSW